MSMSDSGSPAVSPGEGLDTLFNPKSVAVIGASTRPATVGHAAFHNILFSGYQGCVYPVNPKATSVLGVQAKPSILDIEDEVDLAVLVVPSAAVPKTLEQVAEKGTKSAIVITAGFKEVGGAGVALEQDLKDTARANGIRVLGPNCLGLINTDPAVQLNASFARIMPAPGQMALMSQSGALCTAILEYAKVHQIGFSKFISFGNKADISEIDLLAALADDPLTNVILMYLEDLTDGQTFIDIAQQVTRSRTNPKPILAIKTGRSAEGAAAAASHTGSLAGSDEVYDAIMEQGGVLRVDTIEELFHYATVFETQPPPKGRRIGIVTNAGGPGIMATDASVRAGLTIPRFDEHTLKSLKNQLPPTASTKNPVDVIGDARHDRYLGALEAVVADDNADSVLVIVTPQTMTDLEEIAQTIVDVESFSEKPIATSFMGLAEDEEAVEILRKNRIPHYSFPEAAVRSIAALARFGEWSGQPHSWVREFEVDRAAVQQVFDDEIAAGRTSLPEIKSLSVLSAYGIPTAPFALATDRDEAVAAAKEMGFPVVIKIASPDILHKTEVGGVKVGIANEDDLATEFDAMLSRVKGLRPEADMWGLTIQKMLDPGNEVILGSTRDPRFGPLLMFGLGGIYTEALKDVAFGLAPLPEGKATEMIGSIRSAVLLQGFRGAPVSDTPAVAECMQRLSQLVTDFPSIKELDINPLIVYPTGEGAKAADARIILSEGLTEGEVR